METIITVNGMHIEAFLIKEYLKGKLFFAQERLVICTLNNEEITSKDLIGFVSPII